MTLDQAIDRYNNNAEYERRNGSLQGCMEFRQLAEWLKDYKRLLEQQPCEDIAQERYKDLCEYFGGAKDILKSREDFKAWLERIKWHIRKAEELYEKYEYKKQPCDAISREAALEKMADYVASGYADSAEDFEEYSRIICQLPPVTPQQKTGRWEHGKEISREYRGQALVSINYLDWHCSNCHCVVEQSIKPKWDYCPSCGAKMVEPQESEEV